MKNGQRLIKYGAIAFAFVLIFGIFSSIIYGIDVVFSIFDDSNNDNYEMVSIDMEDTINFLDIDVEKIDLEVKSGDDFRIEVSNVNKIRYSDEYNKLVIKEKGINLFNDETKLFIYVPDDKIFDSVSIDTTVGSVNILKLNTKDIDLDLGMGSVVIDYLNVTRESSISAGVGELVIRDGIISDLELDMGVGDGLITASVLGESEINCGVGKLELNLNGSLNDYKIEVDEGIGDIKVDGVKLSRNVYGNGNNYIDIDGGVGEILVNFLVS